MKARKVPKRVPEGIDVNFPQAIDIEEAVLGTIMLENSSLESVENILIPSVFYQDKHKQIFQAITQLRARGEPYDILMVSNELQSMDKLESIGGAYYITQLTSRVVSSANITFHAGILFQKYLLRQAISLAEDILNKAVDNHADAFEIIESAIQVFESLNSVTDHLIEADNQTSVQQTINDVIGRNHNDALSYYKTGITGIDNIIGLSANELLLIGGAAGAGKTRFVIALIDSLLKQYPEVSVQWFNFEDPKEKIIRCFGAKNLIIKEQTIRGKKGKMTQQQLEEFLEYMKVFEKYDIVFIEDTKYIRQVGNLFHAFCKSRTGRLNICIIDNLLLLEDSSQDRDDIIARELIRIRKKTRGLIIPIHHYNDEQMAKDMLKYAYRPRIVHLKGRESYRRACTQIMLINKPGNYADLVAEYKGLEEIFKHLFIIDIAKNRDGIANEDSETLIRLWADLDYLTFKEI